MLLVLATYRPRRYRRPVRPDLPARPDRKTRRPGGTGRHPGQANLKVSPGACLRCRQLAPSALLPGAHHHTIGSRQGFPGQSVMVMGQRWWGRSPAHHRPGAEELGRPLPDR